MVRAAERAPRDERMIGREQAGDAVDARDSMASSSVSGGMMVGSRRASMVLPAPGGPTHEHVVRTGDGHLESAFGLLLAANVGEVGAAGEARSRADAVASAGGGASTSPPRPELSHGLG